MPFVSWYFVQNVGHGHINEITETLIERFFMLKEVY